MMEGPRQRTARQWSRWWPVALLSLLTVTAAGVVAWMTGEAIRNERLAARQLRADAALTDLRVAGERLAAFWKKQTALVRTAWDTEGARAAFNAAADSTVLLNEHGRPLYPEPLENMESMPVLQDEGWPEAKRKENERQWTEAAALYAAIAHRASAHSERLFAAQSSVRCSLRAGDINEALRIRDAENAYPSWPQPFEARLAAFTDLMLWRAVKDAAPHAAAMLAERLRERAADRQSGLPSSVRRLILHKLGMAGDPAYARELLAAQAVNEGLSGSSGLRASASGELLYFTPPGERFVLIWRKESLLARLNGEAQAAAPQIFLTSPGAGAQPDALTQSDAGPLMAGWSLHFREPAGNAGANLTRYAWIGGLSVLGLTGLTVLAGLSVRGQVRRAQLREDLAAAVSHELKTPLSSMRLLVDSLLEDDPFDAGRTREYLQIIAKENLRLSRLVDNFLTLSRLERTRNPLDHAAIGADELASRAAMMVRGTAAGARLDSEIPEAMPAVVTSPEAMVTALLNLVDNAAKYSPPESRIRLSASAADGEVTFAVCDAGPGITTREQSRIWRPFTRLSRDAARPGCGLGLAIVRAVAEQSGGRAEVSSEPGKGSTFRIILPAATGAAASSA